MVVFTKLYKYGLNAFVAINNFFIFTFPFKQQQKTKHQHLIIRCK